MKDVVLYFGGGAMSGVFGAGIAAALQEINFYDNIQAVHAVSSGVINAAYFLTYDSETGASLYWDDFAQEKSVNVHHVINSIQKKKILNVQQLTENKIPLYAKLSEDTTGDFIHFDIREGSPIKVIQAALDAHSINGKEYSNAAHSNPFGIDYLVEKYPESRIVACINTPLNVSKQTVITSFLKKILHIHTFQKNTNEEKMLRKDMIKARGYENVLLLTPPADNPTTESTTDPEKLKQTFFMGKVASQQIHKFLQ